MEKTEFNLILSLKVEQILNSLQDTHGLSSIDARIYLYSSNLYSLLEKEDTKVWYFSPQQLLALLQEEKEKGEITSW